MSESKYVKRALARAGDAEAGWAGLVVVVWRGGLMCLHTNSYLLPRTHSLTLTRVRLLTHLLLLPLTHLLTLAHVLSLTLTPHVRLLTYLIHICSAAAADCVGGLCLHTFSYLHTLDHVLTRTYVRLLNQRGGGGLLVRPVQGGERPGVARRHPMPARCDSRVEGLVGYRVQGVYRVSAFGYIYDLESKA